MKELSIEEKAKRYDEAIEKAKELQHYNCWVTSIFPELKESEDEKIRKEIISTLQYANHKGIYDKHLAWLEKQGEKPQGKAGYEWDAEKKELKKIHNALEVKEVDLTKEVCSYIESSLTGTNPIYTKGAVSHLIDRTAKHFFELGLKAQKGE